MGECSSRLTCGQGPSDSFPGLVSLSAPDGRVFGEGRPSAKASMQAWLCQSRELSVSPLEPATCSGGVGRRTWLCEGTSVLRWSCIGT